MIEDPLMVIGKMAAALDSPEVADSLSPSQWRLLRKCTDDLRTALENSLGTMTPPLLVAVMLGATLEANTDAETDPVVGMMRGLVGRQRTPGQEQPAAVILLILGMMSRDLLTEESSI